MIRKFICCHVVFRKLLFFIIVLFAAPWKVKALLEQALHQVFLMKVGCRRLKGCIFHVILKMYKAYLAMNTVDKSMVLDMI